MPTGAKAVMGPMANQRVQASQGSTTWLPRESRTVEGRQKGHRDKGPRAGNQMNRREWQPQAADLHLSSQRGKSFSTITFTYMRIQDNRLPFVLYIFLIFILVHMTQKCIYQYLH